MKSEKRTKRKLPKRKRLLIRDWAALCKSSVDVIKTGG